MVKECLLPIPTNGQDFKSTLRLFDLSTQDGYDGLSLVIFRPEHLMPRVGAGDVIIMQSAKLQRYKGDLSLVTHHRTCLHVYQASIIPQYPQSANLALKADPRNPTSKPLLHAEAFVSWLYHSINKSSVPSDAQFREKAEQSLNLKDKFSRLEHIREGRFYDLVVQVVREPYDLVDKATVWITDYTENETFFPMTAGCEESDPYNYTPAKSTDVSQSSTSAFEGPYGKRCMQLTCFETHAAFIKRWVRQGAYVRLKNIQIKYGHNGQNLEGFLRQDREASLFKVQIEVLETTDAENANLHLKELIRRKRDYFKGRKKEIKLASAGTTGSQKRSVVEESGDGDNAQGPVVDLNGYVKCANEDQPASTIKSLIKRVNYSTTSHGTAMDIQLPFTCLKYRVNARVVDFHPPRLLDFACSRKRSETDILSDCSSSSSDMDEEDNGVLNNSELVWEWRFALSLQEASAPGQQIDGTPETVWVFVDNGEAEHLTGLTACDLRKHPDTLSQLRERLFTLWGNLEELKSKQTAKPKAKKPPPKPNNGPPPDSSDEEGVKTRREEDTTTGDAHGSPNPGLAAQNRPFSCCVRQYGVRVPEEDPQKANAGEGKRWERAYGLFGTKVPYT
ncbi:Protection of telomeres protein 1 like [Verticillium longisporum]|nr:Protection of telomeres protein 1 like [Verticillium longisporum]